jgi:hypothetical protein
VVLAPFFAARAALQSSTDLIALAQYSRNSVSDAFAIIQFIARPPEIPHESSLILGSVVMVDAGLTYSSALVSDFQTKIIREVSLRRRQLYLLVMNV